MNDDRDSMKDASEPGDVVEVHRWKNGAACVLLVCPGCGYNKLLPIAGTPKPPDWTGTADWTFNGSKSKPTLSPSILGKSGLAGGLFDRICHSYLRDGVMEFLADCTHEKAGQKVPLGILGRDAEPAGE